MTPVEFLDSRPQVRTLSEDSNNDNENGSFVMVVVLFQLIFLNKKIFFMSRSFA